jgi:hypothetical protein
MPIYMCREKVYTICGPEFGPEDEGKFAVIVRAQYGLKSSGAAWRAHLAEHMVDIGFTSCLADPDVWLRPAVKSDGTKYYEYVFIYTDDILAISQKPQEILDAIDQAFKLKPGSVQAPTTYLGATISKFLLPSGKEVWAMSSDTYLKEAIRNLENDLKDADKRLKSKARAPLPSGYRPELDVSPLLTEEKATYFMSLIGILRWACELGRIDITCEVSMLASFLAMPREGHLAAVMHMFAYLKTHKRSRLVFDDSYVPPTEHIEHNWSDFYGDVKEAIPANAPEPRGKEVDMICFVDADHAGDQVTRRSRSGILIYLNRSPILWYSKKQNTIETSTFGSEFVALKIATELIQGLRYKLRMMGVPIEGPTRVKCDNMSVVNNTTAPESMLKKKSNAIAYHYVREAVASNVIRISYEPSKSNLADVLTKTHTGTERAEFMRKILW